MENIKFGQCSNDDAEVIFNLCKDLIDAYENTSDISYEKVLKWCKDKIAANITDYRKIILDDRTVGYFNLLNQDNEVELDDFYILSPYRNKGIGSAVLKRIIAETDIPLFLYVFSKNTDAIKFYRRFGFIKYKEISNTRFIMRFNNK